ncbi:MAG: NADH-quinone oxidoreductase subunit L [Candidatus Rokubacteria bacterium]|nr:NADH-quinone oxidoreductase subunit L [Candidatus Rokubacteria bacterium]
MTLALWILGLPLFAFVCLGVIAPLRRSGRPAAYLSIAAIAGSLLGALRLWLTLRVAPETLEVSRTWIPEAESPLAQVGLLIDPIATLMLLLVSAVAFLVQLYSLGYLSDETPASLGRYYTFHSLFAFAMLGLVASNNFLQLFVFWELVGLCSYLLIGFWYKKPEAARAAMKAFWVTKFGDIGMLIGIILLWGQSETFQYTAIFERARGFNPDFLILVTILLYLGAVGKSAQFPLHVWLPDAMEGPTPVSALIHAATMVAAGVYLVVRAYPLFELAPATLTLIAWVGAFTALLAASLALVQEDIKRVLAYSTVSQLGYMMAALGAGALTAGYFHLFTHGFFKALLFLGAGAVIHAVGTNDLFRMGGLARAMPQTAIVFVIGALALIGIWPFSGFFSKEAVLGAVWGAGLTLPFLMLALTVFLTAFYMVRVICLAFGGGRHPEGHAHEAPPLMASPNWLLAILSIITGFYAPEFGGLVAPKAHETHGPAFLMPLSLGLAIAGIFGAWLVYQRRVIRPEAISAVLKPLDVAARSKYWLDDLYEGGYRGGLLALSWLIGWVDRYVVDGLVNFASAWTMRFGRGLRQIQTGRAQDYLYGVVAGLILLVVWTYWLI